MPSEIFQPLLHDPLGWKQSKTSYTDHYKWRKYGTASKDKLQSTYSQRYNRQARKQRTNNQRVPLVADAEQPISRVIVLRNREDDRQAPATYRYLPTKMPVFVVDRQARPASASAAVEVPSQSVVPAEELQRPPTAPAAVQEPTTPSAAAECQPAAKEEKQKRPVDANNDKSRHWLTFPNPPVPQKILDAKQRLGQLNIPTTLARPASASNAPRETQPTVRPMSASQAKPSDDQHHFLTFEKRETPDDLRAARHRLDKYRYHPSLDNYPPRPQTCPERRRDSPKPPTPPVPSNQQCPVTPPKSDVWVVENSRPTSASIQRPSTSYVQVVNCDNLPNEYATALEISNAAQNEYEKNVKRNGGRTLDNFVYRLPARLPDSKSVSFITYPSQQYSTGMDNQVRQVARAPDTDLGTWLRSATDKERASALKIVQDVLNPTSFNYDKQNSNRTLSATRKLGRTRTQHKFPCEICEKLLIKRHVWDLSGLDAYICPHQSQGVPVRA